MTGLLKKTISLLTVLAFMLTLALFTLQTHTSAASLISYKITYTSTKVRLTLTPRSTKNTIYYTTDGTSPTTASRVYSSRLSASSKATIRAVELNKNGKKVASLKITIKPRVQKVKFSVTENSGSTSVKLTCATSGAKIYYTTDGSAPSKGSKLYTGKLTLTEPCVIRAAAYKSNMKSSAVTSKSIEVYSDDEVIYIFDIGGGSTEDIPDDNVSTENFPAEVLRLVNIERAAAGVPALTSTDALNSAAEKRASELSSVFDHARPDGTDCFTVLDEYNISYGAAGENIAGGYYTPASVVDGWMNSPGHKSNILGSYFSKIGVGYCDGNWCQIFVG